MKLSPFVAMILAFCSACTKPSGTAADHGHANLPTEKARGKACDIVTQAQMSAILGGPVIAAPGGNERPPSSTECIYSPANGSSPYAELEIDWGGGDAQAVGTAAGLVNSAAPGAVDPLAGLGDRAYQVTADQIFISVAGNLMMIRFLPGSSAASFKARRIFETAQEKMQ
jgi:hypothetical protein